MGVYLIGNITVKDPLLWADYVAGVANSLVPFEARVVFRGEKLDVLAGEQSYDQVVVLHFSDRDSASGWFHSDGYQALIPLRDQAADVVITTYTD